MRLYPVNTNITEHQGKSKPPPRAAVPEPAPAPFCGMERHSCTIPQRVSNQAHAVPLGVIPALFVRQFFGLLPALHGVYLPHRRRHAVPLALRIAVTVAPFLGILVCLALPSL